MVAKWVADFFSKEGIYDGLIHLNGYPFLDPKEEYTASKIADQVMTPLKDLDILTSVGHTVDSLEEVLQSTNWKGYPVVGDWENCLVLGYLGRAELRYAIGTECHPLLTLSLNYE